MPKPEVVSGPTKFAVGGVVKQVWYIRCPQCNLVGLIDHDQYEGRVSVVCPSQDCTYHETHDMRSYG